MRVLWISTLPLVIQEATLKGQDHGAQVAASWILAHFPPPAWVDLHVACLWPGGKQRKSFEFNGAHFHLVPCPSRGRALLLFQRDHFYFLKLFRELKPDIVHGWGTEDSFGLVARRLAPSRSVIGIQGLVKAYRQRVSLGGRWILVELTEWLTLRRAKNVVAESRYSLEAARPLCPAGKLRVIEHPLGREFLSAQPSNGTECTALFVGALTKRKGINDALEAFARSGDHQWKLHVIGSGSPQEEHAMSQLVEKLGLKTRFRHDRRLNPAEILKAMQAAAIFLLPTRIDTGPTALKEALAIGLWPVCYDNTGPREYVHEFQFGSLAKDLDVEDLALVLRSAIETRPWLDPTRRARLHTQTRLAFAPESIWAQLKSVYTEIIDSSHL